MSRFQAVVRFAIHPGKAQEFKRIVEDMIRLTREKDTGTVRFDIFVNDDGSQAVFYEEFVNAGARLEHLENMGENVAAMLAIGDMQADVWTHADPALRASVAGFNVTSTRPSCECQNSAIYWRGSERPALVDCRQGPEPTAVFQMLSAWVAGDALRGLDYHS